MPTGYTYKIVDGNVNTLEEFALLCARAMGACVSMRDEPTDVPIPDRFEPQPYHKHNIDRLHDERANLMKLTNNECEHYAHKEAIQQFVRNVAEKAEDRIKLERIERMYADVIKWTPPFEYEGLRTFMKQQLSVTLEEYTNPYRKHDEVKRMTGTEWRDKKIDTITQSIKYHEEQYTKEVDRCERNTRWVVGLRNCLNGESA